MTFLEALYPYVACFDGIRIPSPPSLAANSVRSVSFGGGLLVREGIRFLRSTSSSGVSR